jgi:hypothetical protein
MSDYKNVQTHCGYSSLLLRSNVSGSAMHEYNHQVFIATRLPQRNGLKSVCKLEITPNHQTTKRKYENKGSLIQQ